MLNKPLWLQGCRIYVSFGVKPLLLTKVIWFDVRSNNFYEPSLTRWVNLPHNVFPEAFAYLSQIRRIMGYAD